MTRILHGIPEPMRAQAVALYWQAFGPKLAPVMGPTAQARHFLTRVMRLHNAFAAVDERGRLVGIAGYRAPEGTFAGGTLADLRAIYGRTGAAWRAALLWRLANGADDGLFLIDGVCVTPEARGQGVGTALMAALCAEATVRGYPAARLEVIDSNLRARALYERLGFVAIQTQSIGLLRHVFGFAGATTMIRPLPAAG
ncbi:MAG: GNAT family N-acetyltransferase [Paracoccaceae bacterium]